MSARELCCDQAIFTSVRSPMGEGYRIVASSRGLKANEKQVITRFSPSHEALCAAEVADHREGEPLAVSFYSLPTGRLCVACSCYAGAEHTGRGGQRVYTCNLVFDAADFSLCGFNPFAIVRAMSASGGLRPQLKPPAQLDPLRFTLDPASDTHPYNHTLPCLERSPTRVLEPLFEDRSVVLNTASHPLETAEWVLAGLPGPLRAAISFSAGLRYSIGRTHRLQVLLDENHACRDKVRGQRIEYADMLTCGGASETTTGRKEAAWFAMIDRCWGRRDLARLLARTSRPLSDASATARERIGGLYMHIDSLESEGIPFILDTAERYVSSDRDGAEGEIVTELLATARTVYSRKLSDLAVDDLRLVLRRLTSISGRGCRGTAFAGPLFAGALTGLANKAPVAATEALLQIHVSPAWHHVPDRPTVVSTIAMNFREWLGQLEPGEASASPQHADGSQSDEGRLRTLVDRLVAIFPDEPAVQSCRERCAQFTAARMAAASC